ncbi:hypothetical protein UPYG_G00281490 [Umbra pygmaea]|uniref:Fibronectin type-III domain-containing protein n=1 Tax=Umbra pygmaea TaxID=75934 RepID=A0ABD0WMG6_UMBPY
MSKQFSATTENWKSKNKSTLRLMARPGRCHSESAPSRVLCPEPTHVRDALEVLSRSAQESKQQLLEEIVQCPKRESYVTVLEHSLTSTDSWLCSTAAYLLGVLVEEEEILQYLQASTPGGLVRALGQLLDRDDPDVVLNAAGALASLVKSSAGRCWLLKDQAVFGHVLAHMLTQLEQGQENMVNCTALILARLSQCDVFCQGLLHHPSAPSAVACLEQCLVRCRTDTAMNAAFALGHLCVHERCRSLIVAAGLDYQLTEDQDSVWFAAMAVNVFVSRPAGVFQVRQHRLLELHLKSLSSSPSIGQELRQEVDACLRKLKRLAKPLPPTARHFPPGVCTVSWEKNCPESGLEVTYSLLDNDTALYCGTQCHVAFPVAVLKPRKQLFFRLVHCTSDGDTSPCSEPVPLVIESEGAGTRPGPLQQLDVIGRTACLVRLSWVAPAGELKPKVYQLYRGETLVKTTTELGAVVGGLSPGTMYHLAVCAVGPGDEAGPCSVIDIRTAEGHDHAPSGLTMAVLGRHELQIMWGTPTVPLGRLFNYELRLNGHVVYLGTERSHTARRLAVNTAYTCTVAAITSRGRCQSQPVTKRTARDEYPHTQRCLYSSSRQAPHTAPTTPSVMKASEVRHQATSVRKKAQNWKEEQK